MDIKLNYTFRRQLEVGELFDVMLVMVSEWSDEDGTNDKEVLLFGVVTVSLLIVPSSPFMFARFNRMSRLEAITTLFRFPFRFILDMPL